MEKYDWNDITGRLTRLLRPQTTPVGMKWVRTEEDLRAIPKVRIHDKHLPPCTIVSHAAQFNWTSACRAENVHANYCRGINGMFAPDEKWYSGKMFENVWYDNLDASKAHNRALDCVPPEYVALVASPLTAGRIEPDVCVLYLSPAQAFLFLAGYQYHEYEKLEFTFVGESTCLGAPLPHRQARHGPALLRGQEVRRRGGERSARHRYSGRPGAGRGGAGGPL